MSDAVMLGERTFQIPPLVYTDKGEVRRVGFEFEYAGVGIEESTRLVRDVFGGEVSIKSTFEHAVEGTRFGNFSVEIDTSLLKQKRYENFFKSLGVDLEQKKRDGLEHSLLGLFSKFTPFEISSPPIPITELAAIERLQQLLRHHGAQGTKASFRYAFGLHLNIEIPSPNVDSLLSYLRAFVLLYPWLKEKVAVDITRRLSPYVAPFPKEYVQLILDERYSPNIDTLVADYLRFNPTRNRPLDMLPVFAFVDESRIREVVVDMHLVKARPAFHYRMPNCLIDDPSWALSDEWNTWVAVEKLASTPAEIQKLIASYKEAESSSFRPFYDRWPQVIDQYMTAAG